MWHVCRASKNDTADLNVRQRAFRERKERHVKDLEAKLSALESSATLLATDNQRLKLALQRATTENEILRQQTSRNRSLSMSSPANSSPTNPSAEIGSRDTLHSTPSPHGLSQAESEGRLLPASATWDLIQSHPLVRQGHVDIADVCERLRHAARCDESGPVFAEREVRNAVEESRRGGGDELI
jgi:AP-1-like transcription factor